MQDIAGDSTETRLSDTNELKDDTSEDEKTVEKSKSEEEQEKGEYKPTHGVVGNMGTEKTEVLHVPKQIVQLQFRAGSTLLRSRVKCFT